MKVPKFRERSVPDSMSYEKSVCVPSVHAHTLSLPISNKGVGKNEKRRKSCVQGYVTVLYNILQFWLSTVCMKILCYQH